MRTATISSASLQKVLEKIQQSCKFGYRPYLRPELKKEKVLIDYSSPNIAKPFHAGHLRSTLIGNFVANINATIGHDVFRINYLGDWGMQFGLLGAGYMRYGSESQLANNPIKHLFDVYVKANEIAEKEPSIKQEAKEFLQSMEQGDNESLNLWKRFKKFSIEDYKKIYKRLGIEFDQYVGESQYWDKAPQLLKDLQAKGLLQTTEKGTQEVDLSDLHQDKFSYATVAKSDGSSLYLTRDIVAAIDRYDNHKFDRMYYVVDKSQEGHFKQLVGVLKKMGYSWADRIHHIHFGRVTGMRSRKGEVVFLSDILEKAKSRMLQNMQDTKITKPVEDPDQIAEQLSISELIFQDFSRRLSSDYKFDWGRFLQNRSGTGSSLQYTHARLYSLEQKAGVTIPSSIDSTHLQESEALALGTHLANFDNIVMQSYKAVEPSLIISYLLQLGHLTSSALLALKVRGSPTEIAQARLVLFNSVWLTMGHGMRILGMMPVDQM